jgi:hypothetical protein
MTVEAFNGHVTIYFCPTCRKPGPALLNGRCFRCDRTREDAPAGWEAQLVKDLYTILVVRLKAEIGHDPDLDADIAAMVGSAPLPYTAFAQAAFTLLPMGFWWRGGVGHLSSEVRIGPDYNDPTHRESLLRDYPQALRQWDKGIEIEIRPGGEFSFVRAFAAACLVVHGLGPAPRQPCATRQLWRGPVPSGG